MTPNSPPSIAHVASCVSGYDPDALTVDRAREFIARFVASVDTVEHLPLRAALGRVLAAPVVSALDVPAHDNSAMDGYALRGADLRPAAPTTLRIVGQGLAGQPFDGPLRAGDCVRITTGAVMPPGLDTVVPQEFCQVEGGRVSLAAGVVRPGDNLRRRGEDLACGQAVLGAGRVLRPADLGLMASLGRPEVAVWRRLRVAFFSTGDELRSVGEPLPAGCVYDSNRYTLLAMLQRLGMDGLDLGVVRDDPVALEAAFRAAADCADVVITSGGVGAGEADHTQQVMARLGDVVFWRIAMRPGRPMAFGRLQGPGRTAVLFGLPGNPVAVMVSFYALVREALLRMSGATDTALPMLRAITVDPLGKKPGRTEYQRGIVTRAASGQWQVAMTGPQGSGVLRSMSLANGLVVLPHEQGPVAAGDWVDVLPFDGLV